MRAYFYQWESRHWDAFPPIINTGGFRALPRKAKKRLVGDKIAYNRHQKMCCGIFPPALEKRIRKAMRKSASKEEFVDFNF